MMRILLLILTMVLVYGCSNNDDGDTTTQLSSDKQITSFTFLAGDVLGDIDHEDHTINVEITLDKDKTKLAPTITISDNATITPENRIVTDFTNPVTYTVTAEDGSTQEYMVTVTVNTDLARNVLTILYNANPLNSLGWDFNDPLETWEYVDLNEYGFVTRLNLANKDLNAIPPEIGQLEGLTFLNLANNPINSIPDEIGNLVNITTLALNASKLQNIPATIEKLINLEALHLSETFISTIPKEIGEFANLEYLDLENTPLLTTIPDEVCALKNKPGVTVLDDGECL